jgi:single-strand DNA-binding protein
MNRLTIIGNLTADPEVRTTQNGKTVTIFTVAVNRRRKVEGQPDADFFRISAWNALGENCGKWLIKGRKVAVVGSISLRTYETQSGKHGASMDVLAQEVEFLSQGVQKEAVSATPAPKVDQKSGMEQIETDELPDLPF